MTLAHSQLSTRYAGVTTPAVATLAFSLAMLGAGCTEVGAEGRDDLQDEVEDERALESAAASIYLPHVAKDRFGSNDSRALLTGIQVQNLSTSQGTTAYIYFYESSGTPIPGATVARYIEPGQSFTKLVHEVFPDRAHWSGSAVVQTNNGTPIGVVTNLLEQNPDKRGDAYEGISVPDQRVQLPFVDLRDGASTVVSVQNTLDQTTDVEVRVGNRNATFSLAPRAVRHFDIVQFVGGVTSQGSASGNGRAVVGAEVRADHEVAVTVASRSADSMNVYTAPRVGDGLLPLVNFQPPTIDSWLYVQNTAAVRKDLEVWYRRPQGACVERAYGVGPREVVDFGWSFSGRGYDGDSRSTTCAPGKYVGAAATPAESAAMVVQTTTSGNVEAAYAAARLPELSDSGGGSRVVFPLLMAHNNGWWTGLSLFNASDVSTEVTCDLQGSPGYPSATVELGSIAPHTAATSLQPMTFDSRWIGSAVCNGSNEAELVGVANELLQSGGTNDALMVYRAFEQRDSLPRDEEIAWSGPKAMCDGFLAAWDAAEWTRRPGLVAGIGGSAGGMFGIGVDIGMGTEMVWDFYHHQAMAAWWKGGGPSFGPEFNVASASGQVYLGLAMGFPNDVTDWLGSFQSLDIGVEITTIVNEIVQALTGLGVGVTVGGQFYTSVDDGGTRVEPWNGGTGGAGLAVGGAVEWGYSVPGLMIPIGGPLGLVPEIHATLAGHTYEFKVMTRALYDQMRSGFIRAPAYLVDPAAGTDCHADWPTVDGDDTCVIEFGRRTESPLERALGTQLGLCKVVGIGSCLSQTMLSVASLNLSSAALHQTGSVIEQYCEG